jgi:hypothetical protein
MIAAARVAKAAPDGYTLIAIPGGHATNAAVFKDRPYRTSDDFSPISMVAEKSRRLPTSSASRDRVQLHCCTAAPASDLCITWQSSFSPTSQAFDWGTLSIEVARRRSST